jgi:hypothetical protein
VEAAAGEQAAVVEGARPVPHCSGTLLANPAVLWPSRTPGLLALPPPQAAAPHVHHLQPETGHGAQSGREQQP